MNCVFEMSLNCETNDGFICVNTTRSRRQRNRRKYKISGNALKLLNDLKAISKESVLDLNEMKTKMDSCVEDLNGSHFSDQVLCAINTCFDRKYGTNGSLLMSKISHIICYGLGNFSTSIDSLYQLSLLLILRQFCPKTPDVLVFDPIFTQNEIQFLENGLKFKMIQMNEQCMHSIDSSVDQMVMFFMPHCDKSLFNNLLWSNWTTRQLNQIIIFGNSFHQMIETIASVSSAQQDFNYLFNITNCDDFTNVLIETNIDNNFCPKNIFNDLSIHAFNGQYISEDILQKCYENHKPIYEDSGDVL